MCGGGSNFPRVIKTFPTFRQQTCHPVLNQSKSIIQPIACNYDPWGQVGRQLCHSQFIVSLLLVGWKNQN